MITRKSKKARQRNPLRRQVFSIPSPRTLRQLGPDLLANPRGGQGIELLDFEEKRRVLKMLELHGVVHRDDEGAWIELEGLLPPAQVGVSSKSSR